MNRFKFDLEGINPTFKWPKRPIAVPNIRKEPFKHTSEGLDHTSPCDPVSEKTFKLSDAELSKFNTQSNQYGLRTKTKYLGSDPPNDPKYVKEVNTSRSTMKLTPITEEQINESSNTFKYGEHFKGQSNMTNDLKLILRGVQDNVPVKNTMGPPRKSAGVHSGWIGESLK